MQQVWIVAGSHRNARTGGRHVGIAPDVMIRQGIMPGDGAIVGPEPVSPIIANATLLSEAADRFENGGIGIHPKIATPNIHLDWGGRGGAHPATLSVNDAAQQA